MWLACALAALACAVPGNSGNGDAQTVTVLNPVGDLEAANAAAARAEASAVLARFSPPPGSEPLAGEPGGDGGLLARPGEGPPATPNAVDDTAWWRVPRPPLAVYEAIVTNPPAGAVASSGGDLTEGGQVQERIVVFG
jgi:hypothetical protein